MSQPPWKGGQTGWNKIHSFTKKKNFEGSPNTLWSTPNTDAQEWYLKKRSCGCASTPAQSKNYKCKTFWIEMGPRTDTWDFLRAKKGQNPKLGLAGLPDGPVC